MSDQLRKGRGAPVARPAVALSLVLAALFVLRAHPLRAHSNGPDWTANQAPIAKGIAGLRSLADDVRPGATRMLAMQIRALPPSANKLALAYELANLCTEGDQGQDTVQEAATTLAGALREHPVPEEEGRPAEQYVELAMLATYEDAKVSLENAQFRQAMTKLHADDLRRERINFTLAGLDGRQWTLHDLRGKVVLVNFWATWCPPCRKEMPDLNSLYKEFKARGFVVLAISDEKAAIVRSYLARHKVSYPILLDPGDRVHKRFNVDGIPQSYLYDRDGKLVAEAMDMRTKEQFLGMLRKAGLASQNKLGKELKRISPAKVVHHS
jgi:peroxiredoxin